MSDPTKTTLTQERLKELLRYDPETGFFTWMIARQRVRKGSPAGCLHKHGYWVIKVDGCSYKTSRLAWLYMVGEWPRHQIDHSDLDRRNDRWDNLREATVAQNNTNRRAQKNNSCGVKWAYWKRTHNKFEGQIRIEGKLISAGLFETAIEANDACYRISLSHHGEFSRSE